MHICIHLSLSLSARRESLRREPAESRALGLRHTAMLGMNIYDHMYIHTYICIAFTLLIYIIKYYIIVCYIDRAARRPSLPLIRTARGGVPPARRRCRCRPRLSDELVT